MGGVNHLTDWTPEELAMLNGHKPDIRSSPSTGSDSFMELDSDESACVSMNQSCSESSCCSGFTCGTGGLCIPTKTASSFEWSVELSTAHKIVEQGSCGSCWAVAATAALNLHAEIVSSKRFKKVLSPQSLLACSPNRLECGGQGGCKGATAEVAYDWLKSMGTQGGVLTMDQQPYTASDGVCPVSQSSVPAVSITGWKKIKDNDATEMMNALVTVGPLVTSIAANGLFAYSSGVLGGCSDNVVNHAVVLTGFGHDPQFSMNYWNVRNSWGKSWGEDGFFRLKRAAHGSKEPCGWDNKPEEGVVCKDKVHGKYPKKQWVCGECGFLVDTSYPVGTRVPQELIVATAVAKKSNPKKEEEENDLEDEEDGETSTVDDNEVETVKDNAWCKTQCQRFGMKELSELFDGADFGKDPIDCVDKCDEHVPRIATA